MTLLFVEVEDDDICLMKFMLEETLFSIFPISATHLHAIAFYSSLFHFPSFLLLLNLSLNPLCCLTFL